MPPSPPPPQEHVLNVFVTLIYARLRKRGLGDDPAAYSYVVAVLLSRLDQIRASEKPFGYASRVVDGAIADYIRKLVREREANNQRSEQSPEEVEASDSQRGSDDDPSSRSFEVGSYREFDAFCKVLTKVPARLERTLYDLLERRSVRESASLQGRSVETIVKERKELREKLRKQYDGDLELLSGELEHIMTLLDEVAGSLGSPTDRMKQR